jgi:hypothetical protein
MIGSNETNEVICNIPLCARKSNECQLESALSYYADMYNNAYHEMKLLDPRLVCQKCEKRELISQNQRAVTQLRTDATIVYPRQLPRVGKGKS